MARRKKGAALFELLYRDKGRVRAPDGSLKLPGWFKGKSPEPAPGPAPAAEPDAAEAPAKVQPESEPAPAAPAGPAQAAASKTTGVAVPPPTKGAPEPGPAIGPPPTGRAAVPTSRPAKVADQPRPAGARPPWASAPWFQFEQGHVRIDLSYFAAAIIAAIAVGVLLCGFLLGVYRGRRQTAPVPGQPGVGNVEDGRRLQPDRRTLQPRADARRTSSGGGPTADADAMEPGKNYVRIQTIEGNRDAADKLAQLLRARSFDVVVSPQSANQFLVRTRQGADRAQADQLAEQLAGVLAELAPQQPGLIRFDPADIRTRPYVATYRP